MHGVSSPLLPEILALHGKWRAEQDALICEGQRLSWRQLMSISHQFAHGLLEAGIKPGDRVGVVMSNSVAMVQVLIGLMATGAVSVPINLSVTSPALASMMHDAGVRAIVVTDDQRERIDDLRNELPSSIEFWLNDKPATGWQSLSALCENQPASMPAVELNPDDLLNIIYSSGTTGNPKGIAHTHRGRRDWAYDLTIALRYHGAARTILTIGLYSNISWVGMLCTLLAGGTLIVHQKFDADEFLNSVEVEKATHTAMVPVQYQRVSDAVPHNDSRLDSMQAMMCCGSPLHPDLKRVLFQQFPCGVIELYGLTEGIITTLEPEAADGRWASVGKPLVGTDIMILGEDDLELPTMQSGELVSRGRIGMHSYYNKVSATQESIFVDNAGNEWLRSGDIGYLDEQGYLFIVDRKKDMILSGGQNIYPQDIETVLKNHDAVYDVAVIGVPSRKWGETPLALVIPVKNEKDDEALLAWANQRLGKQQRLAGIHYVDELPRNANGKLLKRELRIKFSEVCYD